MRKIALLVLPGIALLLSGCTTPSNKGFGQARAQQIEDSLIRREQTLTRETEDKILGLDAEHVTEKDISELLSNAPAPRILNIHGGLLNYSVAMRSFSKFLIGMGYPEWSIRNPKTGEYTYSGYEDSEEIAGLIACYYEKDGLRPMIVGHSVGGMQTLRILHTLAEPPGRLSVWNPLTETKEERAEIKDPLTGESRSLTGLQVCYASTLGAGGLARVVTSRWEMASKVRKIPDTVEEFTGFYIGLDFIGGDHFGFGPANQFHAAGDAKVRNVRLPTGSSHSFLPATEKLSQSQALKDWVNNYTPTPALDAEEKPDIASAQMLWAADVWHSIKKHWVLELQRCIRAKRDLHHES